jgi:hypothetical protein
MMKQILAVAAASMVLALVPTAGGQAQTSALVGQPAPQMQAKDLNGKTRSLSEYRGKVVVLCFAASW